MDRQRQRQAGAKSGAGKRAKAGVVAATAGTFPCTEDLNVSFLPIV